MQWLETAASEGGAVLVDKDEDWTSFDVIAKLRGITRIKKAGHAGTLDPLATGLLMVFFHKATTSISEYQGMNKTYRTVVKLGAVTASLDRETEEENITDCSGLAREDINAAIGQFRGKILQEPPAYSAKKIDGKRAYKLARKNVEVRMNPVEIEIHGYENINIDLPYVSFDVNCSKGTYIRSLARDIGAALGCGGYLYALRRTSIGDFSVNDALTIQEIKNLNDLTFQDK